MKISSKLLLIVLFLTGAFIACTKNTPSQPDQKPAVITNVQPKNPAPGDVVTITGSGFGVTSTDVKVTIGTQTVTITSVTDSEIKFTLPAGITAGDIAVAIKSLVATNTDLQKATITPKPAAPAATIISINPTSGKVGDIVTITGTNFSVTATDDTVKFNGVEAKVSAATATSLTVSVPLSATTGAVTLTLKGATAVTGPSFTVNVTATGAASAISYIKVSGGSATVSKIATAPGEIGAMVIDKKNNVIYYADYSSFAPTHIGGLYKLKLDGSSPELVTTDSRINTIINLGVDRTGNNVIVLTGVDKQGVNTNAYTVNVSTGAVTSIATNVNMAGGNYPLMVDSQDGIWNGYGQKLNTTTNKFDRNATFPYASYTSTQYQTDDIYVDNATATNVSFYKYNLLTKVATATDFTISSLFKQDNPLIGGDTHSMDLQARYALDNSENFYVMYPIAGDGASYFNDYYVIRKTKNGAGGTGSLVLKFSTPFATPAFQQPRYYTGLIFLSDNAGNLYMKDNLTDIIKITQ